MNDAVTGGSPNPNDLSWTGGLCVDTPSGLAQTPPVHSCAQTPPVSAIPSSGSAPITVTLCTTLTQAGCTASNNSALVADSGTGTYSGFDGPNPTVPYLEVTTGTTQIPHGATLLLPTVIVTLTAGTQGNTINWSQFEFDTGANINLFGHAVDAPIVAWPSKLLYNTTTTPQCNGLTPAGSPPSCPSPTFVPLNALTNRDWHRDIR